MRGHQPLIAMRRNGKKPRLVCINAHAVDASLLEWNRWVETLPIAQVEILPTESVASLDLRFLVGLPVVVDGHDISFVRRLHDACIAAGASTVLSAVVERKGKYRWEVTEMMEKTSESATA